MFALSLGACGHHGGPGGPGGMGGFALPVAAAPIIRGAIVSTFTVTSTVTPLQQASLSSVVSGNVWAVNAQIGQHVRKGELLVKIDDSTLRAQRAQAAARLAQLQATYAGGTTSAQASLSSAKVAYETDKLNLWRDRQLYSQGYVAKSELDRATNQAGISEAAYKAALVAAQNASLTTGSSAAMSDLRNAQAVVQELDAQIAHTDVSAPFDGIVTARNVDPGTLAAPGTVLMQVSQLDPVYVDAGIGGDDLGYVHVGTPVTVTVDSIPGRAWHAQIAYLNASSQPGTLTYLARVRVANPDLALRGGAVANVAIERARKSGVLIAPRAAIFQTDAGYSMFIIDSGKAKSIPVDLGLSNDEQAEVSGEGLKPGVMAILNHAVTLQPGAPVQVLPAGGGGPPGAGGGPPGTGKGAPPGKAPGAAATPQAKGTGKPSY
jgi:HlyD family secretion protein